MLRGYRLGFGLGLDSLFSLLLFELFKLLKLFLEIGIDQILNLILLFDTLIDQRLNFRDQAIGPVYLIGGLCIIGLAASKSRVERERPITCSSAGICPLITPLSNDSIA